ncbi:MAG: 50S ribosomal protein L17, partial [Deltaproteobacteria bacterium]|nr:50S ribosomal protein L17 [Deltaproteobacteria bacterium]
RTPSHRLALMRNLVTSLLRHEKVKTTDPKAKEVRRWADRMISLGKEGSLHARRRALGVIRDKAVVRKVFETLAPRFKERSGGYTRIVKVGWRRGDHAPISVVELLAGEAAPAESASGGKRRWRRSRRKETAAKKDAASEQTS